MKKSKKIFALVLCLLLMLTPLVSVAVPTTVQAAAKTTLKQKGGEIFAYENGKKVCSQWRTVGKYKYYFTKNGAAYQADRSMGGKHCIVIKTINKKKYAFDINAHMVTGVRIGSTSLYGMPKLFYFNTKTGAYDASRTAKYRKAATTSTFAKSNSAATIKKLLGKAKKVSVNKGSSCFLDGNGKDVQYTYDHIILNVFRPNGSSRELVESVTLRYEA